MRGLSKIFLDCLNTGFLSGITESVRQDPDLNLEIRSSYVNVYYKGNSLLKLADSGSSHYKAEIHKKFLDGINIPLDFTKYSIPEFLSAMPLIKQNIVKYGKRSLEVEYEQMIIRANNYEPRSNTEYYIVDRQYAVKEGRFDLTGIFWDRNHRKKYQEVPVCLMELKFALNTDIREVHNQLARYYSSICPRAGEIAAEMEVVFMQKIGLGLYNQPKDRLDALKTLTFSKEIEKFQFILILVDYNPNSSLLDLQSLSTLPFASQIKVFHSGFAMWQQDMKTLGEL